MERERDRQTDRGTERERERERDVKVNKITSNSNKVTRTVEKILSQLDDEYDFLGIVHATKLCLYWQMVYTQSRIYQYIKWEIIYSMIFKRKTSSNPSLTVRLGLSKQKQMNYSASILHCSSKSMNKFKEKGKLDKYLCDSYYLSVSVLSSWVKAKNKGVWDSKLNSSRGKMFIIQVGNSYDICPSQLSAQRTDRR